MARKLTPFLFLPLVLSVAGGCAVPSHYLTEAEWNMEHGDWYQAWAAIQTAREERPDDPQVADAYWRIRTGWLLWRGQQLVFASREPEAIAEFEKVLALEPEQPIALEWKRKAIDKLADRLAKQGDDQRRAGALDDSLRSYQAALGHEPGNEIAAKGMVELGDSWQRQRDLAHVQFIEGLRAMSEQLPEQARYHFTHALLLDPTLDAVSEPLRVVAEQILAERILLVRAMMDRKQFEAARHELEDIKKEKSSSEAIDAMLAVAVKEAQAVEMKEEGQMALARGQLALARTKLEGAMAVSDQQKQAIGELLLLLHERELDEAYFAAKDIELQGHLDEAIEGFTKLDAKVPGLRDTRERMADITLRIAEAKKALEAGAKAEEAGDLDGALSHYIDARKFWSANPEVLARIARIEAARRPDRN